MKELYLSLASDLTSLGLDQVVNATLQEKLLTLYEGTIAPKLPKPELSPKMKLAADASKARDAYNLAKTQYDFSSRECVRRLDDYSGNDVYKMFLHHCNTGEITYEHTTYTGPNPITSTIDIPDSVLLLCSKNPDYVPTRTIYFALKSELDEFIKAENAAMIESIKAKHSDKLETK